MSDVPEPLRGAVPGWAERIRDAQHETTIRLGGEDLQRVPHGHTPGTYADRECPGCLVLPEQLHVPGCAHETCPRCGGQLLSCLCPEEPDPRRVTS